MKNEHRKERISSFEDLEAWQMARRLVNAIYVLTRLSKVSGDFRLCSQVQAAAVSIMSIMSNVAEGFERTHLQEKIQFYNVARGSAGEVRSLLYVVSDNFAEATAEAERLRDDVTRVGKLVTGLLNSTARRRGIVPRAILAVLSPISYLLTSISFHLR
jgi:four helix bundle protein